MTDEKPPFKRYVARPDEYGVVTIPSNFIPAGDMDPVTGCWEGWILETKEE